MTAVQILVAHPKILLADIFILKRFLFAALSLVIGMALLVPGTALAGRKFETSIFVDVSGTYPADGWYMPPTSVAFFARVSPSDATGTVTVSGNGQTQTLMIVNGQVVTQPFAIDNRHNVDPFSALLTFTATYNGSTIYATSSSTAAVKVDLPRTGTTLEFQKPAGAVGQPSAFTATVTGGLAPVTGSIWLSYQDRVVGGQYVDLGSYTITNRVATGTFTLPAGDYNIRARYGGDINNYPCSGNFLRGIPDTCAVRQYRIYATPSSTALSASQNPVPAGGSATFTATLSGVTNPTGSLTFRENGAAVGLVSVTGPTVMFARAFSNAGIKSIVASYSGDSTNAPSDSAPLHLTVEPP